MKSIHHTLFCISIFASLSCTSKTENYVHPRLTSEYKALNFVIIVIDGPRFIDTWGETDAIPFQKSLSEKGVLFNNIYNEGETFTLSGHAAITTGSYENIKNDGSEYPTMPSIFQFYLKEKQLAPQNCALFTSKSKLRALSNCKDLNWKNSYIPFISAEDRYDSSTLNIALEYLERHHPKLTLIHFSGPDKNGHRADWDQYVQSIANTDVYTNVIWDFLQSDSIYKGKSVLLITNDHGRHLDEIATGFQGHGDHCEGCRHISLLALGPDFEANTVVNRTYSQIDIAPTIATILNFNWVGQGEQINELTQK